MPSPQSPTFAIAELHARIVTTIAIILEVKGVCSRAEFADALWEQNAEVDETSLVDLTLSGIADGLRREFESPSLTLLKGGRDDQ